MFIIQLLEFNSLFENGYFTDSTWIQTTFKEYNNPDFVISDIVEEKLYF